MALDGPSPALKALVYGMGALLIGGTLLLAVLIAQKTGESISGDEMREEAGAASCTGTQIDLKGRGVLRHAKLEGRKVTLWFEAADGMHHLVVADSCSGAVVREVMVEADTAVNP